MQQKYKDQDEEERVIRMKILAVSGGVREGGRSEGVVGGVRE